MLPQFFCLISLTCFPLKISYYSFYFFNIELYTKYVLTITGSIHLLECLMLNLLTRQNASLFSTIHKKYSFVQIMWSRRQFTAILPLNSLTYTYRPTIYLANVLSFFYCLWDVVFRLSSWISALIIYWSTINVLHRFIS